MKILFLISRFLDGGIDTVLVEYLNSLVRLTDHEVELSISLKMNESEVFLPRLSDKVKVHYLVDQNLMTAYKRSKHHHQRNPLLGLVDEVFINPLRRSQMHKRLRHLAHDVDVVVDFDCCHAAFMSSVPKGVRKLAWFHFSLNQELKRDPRRIKRLKKRCQRYDNIVTIAEDMRQEFVDLCPEYASKVKCIYNSVNLETMIVKSSQPLPAEWNDKPYILAIERLEEKQKDLTTLIKAYSLLDMPDKPHLCIIGEGASRPQLEALIHQLGLDQSVHLLGFQSNPYPWIRHAQMLVHSSKFEGFGMVLVEALMLGKIVISTDCPVGPREVLNDGKSGILVPVGDPQAFADAIRRVLTDADLCVSLLANAKDHCRLFTSDKCVSDFNQLIGCGESAHIQDSVSCYEMPLVSVIVPGYNHAPYLRERIDSVLAQDYPNFEVLLLDDKSPDNSAEIMLSYKGREHVREVIINEQNSGNTFLQWDKGINLARGKYIWLAESDDVAQPTFLSKLVSRLEQYPDAVFAYSYSKMIGPKSEDLGYSWDQPWLYRAPGVYDGKSFSRERLVLKDLVYNASMVVFRREYFFRVNPDFKTYRHCGDWFFWFEMAMMGKVIEVPEKLNCFRQHPQKVSNDALKTGADFREMGGIQTYILSKLHASSYEYRVVRGRMIKRVRKLAKHSLSNLAHEWPLIFRGSTLDIMCYTLDKITNKSGFQNDRH